MVDPTIYDNLKVVLEGFVYDLDRSGQLVVIDRADLIDLAAFNRSFMMQFTGLAGKARAKLILSSTLTDFASELAGLRLAGSQPGARLQLEWSYESDQPSLPPRLVNQLITEWSPLSTLHFQTTTSYTCSTNADNLDYTLSNCHVIQASLNQVIDESDLDLLQQTIAHSVETVLQVDQFIDLLQ